MSRVVVVGTGFGCMTHVRALQAAGFEVAALVGRDPAKTTERASLFDIPIALTSLDEALALDDVAAVTVATPPHTHAPIAAGIRLRAATTSAAATTDSFTLRYSSRLPLCNRLPQAVI